MSYLAKHIYRQQVWAKRKRRKEKGIYVLQLVAIFTGIIVFLFYTSLAS